MRLRDSFLRSSFLVDAGGVESCDLGRQTKRIYLVVLSAYGWIKEFNKARNQDTVTPFSPKQSPDCQARIESTVNKRPEAVDLKRLLHLIQ